MSAMITTPKLLPKDTGLLAFLYKVYTDEETANAFKTDPWTTMAIFNLTLEQQRAVWASGLDRDAPENESALMALRNGELPPRVPIDTLKDTKWAYAGPEAEIAAMLVKIMTDDPALYETVW